MPRHRKKKPPKSMWDFEFFFDDVTMVEAEGRYDLAKKLIESEFPYETHWYIKTHLSLISQLGQGNFQLNLGWDKSLVIIGYAPSSGDPYFNPDIRCLCKWAQQFGWNIPEPHPNLVRDNIKFWKHMWETMMVDSPFLDEMFGIRKTLLNERDYDDEDEEIDDKELLDE